MSELLESSHHESAQRQPISKETIKAITKAFADLERHPDSRIDCPPQAFPPLTQGDIIEIMDELNSERRDDFFLAGRRTKSESNTKMKFTGLMVHLLEKIEHKRYMSAKKEIKHLFRTPLAEDGQDATILVGQHTILAQMCSFALCPGPSINIRSYMSDYPDLEQDMVSRQDCCVYLERTRRPPKDAHRIDPTAPVPPGSACSKTWVNEPNQVAEIQFDEVDYCMSYHRIPDGVWMTTRLNKQYQRNMIKAVVEAKSSSGKTFEQILAYLRLTHAVDGNNYAISIHGNRYRLFQISGPDEITTWIPENNRQKWASFVGEGVYAITYAKAEKVFDQMETITFTLRSPIAKPAVMFTRFVEHIGNSDISQIPDLMEFPGCAMIPIKIVGVTIEAITPMTRMFVPARSRPEISVVKRDDDEPLDNDVELSVLSMESLAKLPSTPTSRAKAEAWLERSDQTYTMDCMEAALPDGLERARSNSLELGSDPDNASQFRARVLDYEQASQDATVRGNR